MKNAAKKSVIALSTMVLLLVGLAVLGPNHSQIMSSQMAQMTHTVSQPSPRDNFTVTLTLNKLKTTCILSPERELLEWESADKMKWIVRKDISGTQCYPQKGKCEVSAPDENWQEKSRIAIDEWLRKQKQDSGKQG